MQKNYTYVYPAMVEEQLSFTGAVTRMLNARRYLESQNFAELKSTWDAGINGIANSKGVINFKDGSYVNCGGFKTTIDRDAVLERIIEKNAIFHPNDNYDSIARSQVIKCTYKDRHFLFTLSVIDTTEFKMGFFRRMFNDATLFAFVYRLKLEKDVINDSVLRQFEIYKQGLDVALISDEHMVYSKNTPVGNNPNVSLNQGQSNPSAQSSSSANQTNYFDPWSIKTPKIGDKK